MRGNRKKRREAEGMGRREEGKKEERREVRKEGSSLMKKENIDTFSFVVFYIF